MPVDDDQPGARAATPCEVLTWDAAELCAFLESRPGARLCFSALIAESKLSSYMSLDDDSTSA